MSAPSQKDDFNEFEFTYIAEPTPAKFHFSQARIKGIRGPIGTGKTVCCVAEVLLNAFNQKPFRGVRRTRWAAIRNTYPELKSTTIKTWMDWVPPEKAPIRWDVPITSVLKTPLPDGTIMELEMLFLSMDNPKDVRKLKSLEVTGIWLNEASELQKWVLDMAGGRVARYPPKMLGGPTRDQIIMDTNSMTDDHWWYKLAEEERPRGFAFFNQPPALLLTEAGEYVGNPDCENVSNQSKGIDYWLDQVPGKSHDWIRVYLLNEYGDVLEGSPVYPEYNGALHVSDTPLAVNEGLPLILGWDFGRTPACVICQLTPRGQFLVLRELYEESMGIREFATKIVVPYLTNNFNGMEVLSFGDPAGLHPGQTDDRTCMDELRDAGIPTSGAMSNAFTPRREAVAEHLTSLIDGKPGLLLDPSCKMLRRGFNGRYKYRKMQIPKEDIYSDAPIKNEYSHPHDALQYAALGSSTIELNAKPRRVRPPPNWRT
jgi:hypothetical protein